MQSTQSQMLVAASQKAHHGSSTPSPLSAVASKQRAIRAQRAQRPAEQGFQGACAPLPPNNTQSPHPLAVSLKALPLAKSRAPALPSRNTPPSQQKLTHPQPHRRHAPQARAPTTTATQLDRGSNVKTCSPKRPSGLAPAPPALPLTCLHDLGFSLFAFFSHPPHIYPRKGSYSGVLHNV